MKQPRTRRPIDPVSLLWGIVFLALACTGLGAAFGMAIHPFVLGVVTPVCLIVIGFVGLLIARPRS